MNTPSTVPQWIEPDWPAPPGVRALSTTRAGGISRPPFDSFNLAAHVGDDPARVQANRARLRKRLALPREPRWLTQVHGTRVTRAEQGDAPVEADGCVTSRAGWVCAVLTADCIPVLLCRRDGSAVGAVHAGWRGLAAGVLQAGVAALECPPEDVLAWLGPAIGANAFEVGEDVHKAFIQRSVAASEAFRPGARGHWYADLTQLARQSLMDGGVRKVSGGRWCTYSDAERFYSYRRDGRTGRMASLIWRE